MKTTGLILVAIGTTLAAAFGAQNAAPVQSQQEITGRARVLSANADNALKAYCAILPGGARSANQTADGCPPVPSKATPAEVEARLLAHGAATAAAAAADKTVDYEREVYCDSMVDGALTPEQVADGCSPAKRSASAAEAEALRLVIEGQRTRVTTLELEAQNLRVAYCRMGVQGRSTPTQVEDHCPPAVEEAAAEAIEAARAAWKQAWQAVPAAREAVKEAVGAYCAVEVGGRVIAQQQNEGCPPTKVARTAAEVAALRGRWQAARDEAEAKQAAARSAESAACGVVAGDAWRGEQKDLCFPLPMSGTEEAAAEARAAWQELAGLAASAKAAVPYAASRVAAGERVAGWFERAGLGFFGGLVLIIVGAFLARRAIKAELAAGPRPSGEGAAKGPVDLGEVLGAMARESLALRERVQAATSPTQHDLQAIKEAIEAIQNGQLEPVIETRAQLVNRYGLAGFAEVFGPLSAGERYLNRAWVSLVDRYWEESASALEAAAHHFGEANEALAKLSRPS